MAFHEMVGVKWVRFFLLDKVFSPAEMALPLRLLHEAVREWDVLG